MNKGKQLCLLEDATPSPSEKKRVATIRPGAGVLPRVDLTRQPMDSGRGEPPIERLLRCGPRSLSNGELLTLLLDMPGIRAQDVVEDFLEQTGLTGLSQLDETFFQTSPWEEGPTASLLAAVELARRLARHRLSGRQLLNTPDLIANYLTLRYQADQEIVGVVLLDRQDRLIIEREIYRGTLGRAFTHPRDFLKHVLLYAAASFIVFHTHPSGDPTPSADDLATTRQLAKAAATIGVPLRDHLILGHGGRWVSLYARGVFENHADETFPG